jgi:hypothetical protein
VEVVRFSTAAFRRRRRSSLGAGRGNWVAVTDWVRQTTEDFRRSARWGERLANCLGTPGSTLIACAFGPEKDDTYRAVRVATAEQRRAGAAEVLWVVPSALWTPQRGGHRVRHCLLAILLEEGRAAQGSVALRRGRGATPAFGPWEPFPFDGDRPEQNQLVAAAEDGFANWRSAPAMREARPEA